MTDARNESDRSEPLSEQRKLVHKVGGARTIQTAVLVVEYLKKRFPEFREINYYFTDPTPQNGWWSSNIFVTTWGKWDESRLSSLVETARAFVAGRGEVWT